jgi:hypothetical protein
MTVLSAETGGTIVMSGSVAQRPFHGGHTWVFLQYLLGFRRLGWGVVFIDRLEPEMYVDAAGQPCQLEECVNVPYLTTVMQRFGLGDNFALLLDGGSRSVGLSRTDVLARTRRSALLLNVNGFLQDDEIVAAAPQRVYLDIDPGFGQMWRELGLVDPFGGHDSLVTIAQNMGREECPIPTCGLDWLVTPQPVVLTEWPAVLGGETFSTVAAWRGPHAPVDYEGRTFGLRVHEFRRFAEIPRLTGQRFEIALDIDSADHSDTTLLEANHWRIVDPRVVAADPWTYRDYIQGAMAEFMVAKNMYVQTNSGWVSDRSICYLASGKPVIAQDTALSGLYPTGEGLLTFSTLDEAAAAVEDVRVDYQRHAKAARAIAEEHFDSDRVLGRLLTELGVN